MPIGFQPDSSHQRHESAEEFSDAATVTCRVDVTDSSSCEFLCEESNFFYFFLANYWFVLFK